MSLSGQISPRNAGSVRSADRKDRFVAAASALVAASPVDAGTVSANSTNAL